jgi:hypothetical protein
MPALPTPPAGGADPSPPQHGSHRVRRRSDGVSGEPAGATPGGPAETPAAPEHSRRPRHKKAGAPAVPTAANESRDRPERDPGLAGLVASGPSKVGIQGAMRARDVSRPRQEDLDAAERELVIRQASRPGTF